MKRPSRTLTTLAVGFLLLDAALLGLAGVWLGRPWLFVPGGVFLLIAGAVLVAWRRYRRILAELEAARRDMRAEVEAIRDLLHSHHFDN